MARAFLVVLFSALVLTPHTFHCRPNADNENKAGSKERVTGGNEAPIGRFPFMCSLRKRGNSEHRCGGTLVRGQWVLTAAHCIDPDFRRSVGLTPIVYCGAHKSDTNDQDFIFNAVEGYTHPSWTGNTDDGYDVGLLKLDRRSNARLPGIDTHGTPLSSGELLTALGWGRTENQQTAETLQMARNLHYVSPESCEEQLGDIFEDHMICAGLVADTCEGDSGGPLLIPHSPDGNLTAGRPQNDLIIGVTSFGPEACDASSPGVYISTSYMWEWIVSVVGEDDTAQSEISIIQPETSPSSVEAEAESDDRSFDFEGLTDTELRQRAVSAIENDDATQLDAILLHGLDADTRYEDPRFEYTSTRDRLLHFAARMDSSKCVKVLIDNGADVHAENYYYQTPLHYTAFNGSVSAARVLLQEGADVDAEDSDEETPLDWAAIYDQFLLATVLIEEGASLDHTDEYGDSPLLNACWRGNSKTIKVLLEHGADIHAVTSFKETPLHAAAHYGHPRPVQILLNNGAETEATDEDGQTPLYIACDNGSEEVARVLVENGADVNSRTFIGETPLHAASRKGYLQIVQFLLSNDADVTAFDQYGDTPLSEAAYYGFLEIAEVLVEAGARKDTENDNGYTPYDVVCNASEADCTGAVKSSLQKLLSV